MTFFGPTKKDRRKSFVDAASDSCRTIARGPRRRRGPQRHRPERHRPHGNVRHGQYVSSCFSFMSSCRSVVLSLSLLSLFSSTKRTPYHPIILPSVNHLLQVAKSDSRGRRPDGRCYSHVSGYIDKVGYGGIQKNGFDSAIPSQYWAEAHDFADYLNKNGNAARLGLKNTHGNNPYHAPAGSIVVVRAGTPGTANPTAGDIAVADGGSGNFWNGGDMGYGGSSNFPPGNTFVLGIFVPTRCSGQGPSPGPSPGPPVQCSACKTCVKYGGGQGCLSQCQGCGSNCVNCIKGGGGTACASKC